MLADCASLQHCAQETPQIVTAQIERARQG